MKKMSVVVGLFVFLAGIFSQAFQNPFACEIAFDPYQSVRDFQTHSFDYSVGVRGQEYWGDTGTSSFPASYGLRAAAQVTEDGAHLPGSHADRVGDERKVLFKNGLGVDGLLVKVIMSKRVGIAYLSFAGPTNFLSVDQSTTRWNEIPNQTAIEHFEGFGTAMGPVIGYPLPLSAISIEDLAREYGIQPGKKVTLKYESGVLVTGVVNEVQENPSQPGNAGVIQFVEGTARVTLGEQVLFDPSWGTYDLLLADGLYDAKQDSKESIRAFRAKVAKLKAAIVNGDQALTEQLFDQLQPADSEERAILSEALGTPRL